MTRSHARSLSWRAPHVWLQPHHLDDESPEHVILRHAIELEASILEEVDGMRPHHDQGHVHDGGQQPYQVPRLEKLVLRKPVVRMAAHARMMVIAGPRERDLL